MITQSIENVVPWKLGRFALLTPLLVYELGKIILQNEVNDNINIEGSLQLK